jgi:hypothetical protein
VTVVSIDFVYGLKTVPPSEKRGSQANNKVCIITIIYACVKVQSYRSSNPDPLGLSPSYHPTCFGEFQGIRASRRLASHG